MNIFTIGTLSYDVSKCYLKFDPYGDIPPFSYRGNLLELSSGKKLKYFPQDVRNYIRKLGYQGGENFKMVLNCNLCGFVNTIRYLSDYIVACMNKNEHMYKYTNYRANCKNCDRCIYFKMYTRHSSCFRNLYVSHFYHSLSSGRKVLLTLENNSGKLVKVYTDRFKLNHGYTKVTLRKSFFSLKYKTSVIHKLRGRIAAFDYSNDKIVTGIFPNMWDFKFNTTIREIKNCYNFKSLLAHLGNLFMFPDSINLQYMCEKDIRCLTTLMLVFYQYKIPREVISHIFYMKWGIYL